jgi:formylglycine-generating enzyme required for sulfatase activity
MANETTRRAVWWGASVVVVVGVVLVAHEAAGEAGGHRPRRGATSAECEAGERLTADGWCLPLPGTAPAKTPAAVEEAPAPVEKVPATRRPAEKRSAGAAAPASAPASAGPRPRPPGEWVEVRAGSFVMGSPAGEVGRGGNETQHAVTLTRGFVMQATEVTQEQFAEVLGYNPSHFAQCGPTCPVDLVSWHEAAAYANRLSRRERLGACYSCRGSGAGVTCAPVGEPYACRGYRLPTEAEWEYAARAGTTGPRYGDLDVVAWYSGNAGGTPHPVGQKQANGWGLYDMLGNVWEWCHDLYDDYPGAARDPGDPGASSNRVLRGSFWNVDGAHVRAARRDRHAACNRYEVIGFRPVRSSP